jgi:hypothetical protein
MAFGFLKDFLDNAADFLEDVRDKAAGLSGRVRERFNANPKLKIIFAAAVLGMVLVVAGVMLILTRSGRAPRRTRDSEDIAELFRMEIPPEDLFLGDEPDFLPDMLPEREQRGEWTGDDVRPYWTNPGDEGVKVYEDMMGAVVDGIMERVP